MVFLILCTRWCLNVRERRAPESQTPPIFPRSPPSLASLASLSLLLLFSAPLPLPLSHRQSQAPLQAILVALPHR